MQHFQSILIVIGIVAISGVLIHGYLLSRKEKEAELDQESTQSEHTDMFSEQAEHALSEELTDEVISEVRIISHHNEEKEAHDIDFSQALHNEKVDPVELKAIDLEVPLSINEEDLPEVDKSIEETAKLQAVETQLLESEQEKVVQHPDIFIFNVAAKDGKLLGGHELLQFFLTAGFRFGEMSIFHRHQHSDGTGPVLFSIANMMAPGIFEPDCMEQFQSEGVSFFLTAPNDKINIKESFDMMLRAVEQMAEEFDCIVLNGDREKMTTEQFIEYNNRLLQYI